MLAVALVVLSTDFSRQFSGSPDFVVMPFAVAALLLFSATVVLRPWSDALGADVRSGEVNTSSGIARVATREGHGLESFLLEFVTRVAFFAASDVVLDIGGRQFKVPKPFRKWIDGQAVRAYYLPRSMTLVAFERVDGPPVVERAPSLGG